MGSLRIKGTQNWESREQKLRQLESGCLERREEANQSHRRQDGRRGLQKRYKEGKQQSDTLENLERQSPGFGENASAASRGVPSKGSFRDILGLIASYSGLTLMLTSRGKKKGTRRGGGRGREREKG